MTWFDRLRRLERFAARFSQEIQVTAFALGLLAASVGMVLRIETMVAADAATISKLQSQLETQAR